ncbi:MAG: hypothetical protein ACLVHV_16650 [Oscillospiraceae bacterium]
MPEFIMKNSDGDREAVRAEAREAMGAAISEAEAEYRPDGRLYDAMEPPAGEVPREPPSTRELRERSYEYGLPEYLQHDLDAYKEGLKNGSSLLDCLWGESFTAASTRRKSMMGPSRRSMRIISDKNFCGEADSMSN